MTNPLQKHPRSFLYIANSTRSIFLEINVKVDKKFVELRKLNDT